MNPFGIASRDSSHSGIGALVLEMGLQQKAEEDPQTSQESMQLLLDSLAQAVLGLDANGHCTFCNPACLRLLGYEDANEIFGRDIHALAHHSRPDGSPFPLEECSFHRSIRGSEKVHITDELYWRKDGTNFLAESWAYPIVKQGKVLGTVVTLVDITERRATERLYLEEQKRQAVGRLAGGVAHDFNNLLSVILGYAELLERQLAADDGTRQMLEEITRAANRATSLTHQMLAFSGQQVLQARVFDINSLVRGMEETLRRLTPDNVRRVTRLGRPVHVNADPEQIDQALINLVINACDAMPEGGTVTIETAASDLDALDAQIHPEASRGAYVLVSVADTGGGLSREAMAHLFEPFFTTKGMSRSSGLGLATAQGILRQSGGFITVSSDAGRGSAFTMHVPRAEAAGEPLGALEPNEEMAGGFETILLTEDGDSLREMTRVVLESNGYSVLEAAKPSEALAMASDFSGPIHLLLTDVILPEMNGRALAERIEATHPETRVLYISAYIDDVLSRHGLLESGILFLAKPFTQRALLRKVRAALGSPHARRGSQRLPERCSNKSKQPSATHRARLADSDTDDR